MNSDEIKFFEQLHSKLYELNFKADTFSGALAESVREENLDKLEFCLYFLDYVGFLLSTRENSSEQFVELNYHKNKVRTLITELKKLKALEAK